MMMYSLWMNELPFDIAFEEYPLAPSTYYKVGGPARLALLPRNVEEAVAAYEWMYAQAGPHLILGGASNVLVPDSGFPGIVLFTNGMDCIEELGNDHYLVQGGVELDQLVREVIVPHNYSGTGALAGIPGTVGGAIYMNAGTVNGSTCELLETVNLFTHEGRVKVIVEETLYGYRSQNFCKPCDLILDSIFKFEVSMENQKEVYDHYLERRKEKQPQGNCCGSVFKNLEDAHAGKLIEACGLKGTRRGGAEISMKHANFIMNENNATFDDIVWLIELCKKRVREQFGVELQEEVRIIQDNAIGHGE